MPQETRQEQLKAIHDKAKALLSLLHKGDYEKVKEGLEEIIAETQEFHKKPQKPGPKTRDK